MDGCYLRDDPENQGCCSASIPVPPDDTADNYWRLNLTRLYQVERIVIYARTGDYSMLLPSRDEVKEKRAHMVSCLCETHTRYLVTT